MLKITLCANQVYFSLRNKRYINYPHIAAAWQQSNFPKVWIRNHIRRVFNVINVIRKILPFNDFRVLSGSTTQTFEHTHL